MSLRSDILNEADTYKHAFLVAQTASILRKAQDIEFGDSEVKRLEWAKDFLDKLIVGTEILTKTESWSFTSYESIRAVGFVLNPIESLQAFVRKETSSSPEESQVLKLFREIESYLGQIITQRHVIESQDKKLANDFFAWLSKSLLESVSRSPFQNLTIERIQQPS